MNRDLIEEFLGRAIGFPKNGKQIADGNYLFPTEGWIANVFARALRQTLLELGLSRWSAEENDCDDFARLASVYAAILHRQTLGREKGTALAFGEFWYVQDTGDAHAINFFITTGQPQEGSDETAALRFFEPQTQRILTLSEKEIKSCSALRL